MVLRAFLNAVILGVFVMPAGCHPPEKPWQPVRQEKDYGRPLPPGELALRKIPLERYPDFSRAYYDRVDLEQAVLHSLDYLSRPSSQRYFPYGEITHEQAVASLNAFLEDIRQAQSPEELNQRIRARYDVYQSVGCDGRGTVFFTGYYTPIFDARKQPDATFRYPLYKFPADLVKDEEGQTLGRRTADGQIVPYPSRREIEEQQLLAGREIVWLSDPFEAYVVTVQGSAKLRMADGTLYELGYAGNNGHEYTSVAQRMVADGAIGRNELSLQAMIRYFDAHPDRVNYYCWQNPRYVFFKETAGGPFGSINVPVTPRRSLATDKTVFPRACLAFLDTRLPLAVEGRVTVVPYAGFALDQDTGGAIRAAGRGDLYMGVGPQAEALAGRTGAEGALYYLFVREWEQTSE